MKYKMLSCRERSNVLVSSIIVSRKVLHLGLETFLSLISRMREYQSQLAYVEHFESRLPTTKKMRMKINPLLSVALELKGIESLFSHQADSIDLILEGKNVIVTSGPSSGKSLIYYVPTLESFLTDKKSTALYMFPTKALAQDQMDSLNSLVASLPKRPVSSMYDGDTPYEDRPNLRGVTNILFTNPDMLHLAILPNHKRWSKYFKNLKYIVLDEAHQYKGVYGSHIALLIRRLRRICSMYGANPKFILTSATLGNPREHAEALLGVNVESVEHDGSYRGKRDFALWNPPIIEPKTGMRRSYLSEGVRLFVKLVEFGSKTLAFARSRQTAELLHKYSRDELNLSVTSEKEIVGSYRAGYLPEDRKQIEHKFISGELLGLVSTNALELGINIGDLDSTLLIGYPGSLASTMQQAFRSGRGDRYGLSIMVLSDNPLEQYIARHPDLLFRRGAEYVLLDANNELILSLHLMCAAYEKPLIEQDSKFFGPSKFSDVLDLLTSSRKLLPRKRGDDIRWYVSPTVGYPASDVNLRSGGDSQFSLLDTKSAKLLEMIGKEEALRTAYPGAVYLHQGQEFLVERIDFDEGIVHLTEKSSPYYTQSLHQTRLTIVQEEQSKLEGEVPVFFGELEVARSVVGFQRKRHGSNELISGEKLDLPEYGYNTKGIWWTISQELLDEAGVQGIDIAEALHALEHAAIGLLPVFASCDRWDIGGVSTNYNSETNKPTVFIYDGHPGGVGISYHAFSIITQLWQTTLEHLKECPCEDGCPSCVMSPKCGNNNDFIDKEGAKFILERLLNGSRNLLDIE